MYFVKRRSLLKFLTAKNAGKQWRSYQSQLSSLLTMAVLVILRTMAVLVILVIHFLVKTKSTLRAIVLMVFD
jgi:hypothetical protein